MYTSLYQAGIATKVSMSSRDAPFRNIIAVGADDGRVWLVKQFYYYYYYFVFFFKKKKTTKKLFFFLSSLLQLI